MTAIAMPVPIDAHIPNRLDVERPQVGIWEERTAYISNLDIVNRNIFTWVINASFRQDTGPGYL